MGLRISKSILQDVRDGYLEMDIATDLTVKYYFQMLDYYLTPRLSLYCRKLLVNWDFVLVSLVYNYYRSGLIYGYPNFHIRTFSDQWLFID